MLALSIVSRRRSARFVAGIVAAVAAADGLALDPATPPERYSHRAWTTEDGLPQDTVQAITQDERGYLWLGTQEGLARFDGVRFTTLSTRSMPRLPANNVLTLLGDALDGSLWFGTRGGGLGRLRGHQLDVIGEAQGLASRQVRCLLRAPDGGVWFGTRGGGLQHLGADGVVSPPVTAIGDALVLDLCRSRDGALWVATEGRGVCRIQDGETGCLTAAAGLPANFVWSVYEDRAGTMWIGTYGGGLVALRDGRMQVYTTADGLTSDRITCLHEDRHGNLWVGTHGGGLNRLRDGRFMRFTSREGLTDDSVLALYEDREGSLWIGTVSGGLNRIKDSLFTVYDAERGLSSSMARVVLEDARGRLWIGTSGGGLFRLDDTEVRQLTTADGLPAMDVFSLWEEPGGAMWVGTYGGGVARLEEGRFTNWSTANSLPHDTVWAITGDHAGNVWIGTYGGGLVSLRNGELTTFAPADGLPSNLIRALLVARDGSLWIGTSGGGLARYRDGTFTHYGAAQGLSNQTVFALYEDARGSLWVGTNGGGLNLLDGDRLRSVSTREGLFDDVIFRILEDARGTLWMSSNRGIFRVAKEEVLSVLGGTAPTLHSTAYGRADGMPTSECNGGSQPAGWKTAEGELLFPTPRGVVALDPRRLAVNPKAPPVLVEAIIADGVSQPVDTPVVLPPGTRNLQIDYTALSFLAPEKVAFRYRLEGGDDGWTWAGDRRTAFFSHLPPGSYTFRVTACNNDGVWNQVGAALPFRLRPYFYQTTFFYAAGALLLMLTGFAAAYGRVVSHRRRSHELESLVDARTSELQRVTRALEAANRRLEILSLSDPLTGVANRRRFDSLLELAWARALRSSTPVSLLMVDIDHFKAFNDRLGHPEGDRCLRHVAELLGDGVRRATDLVARYGGEEFAVVLEGVAQGSARDVAEDLRRRVEEACITHPASPVAPVITVSVGVASRVPALGSRAGELLAAADRALYRAKQGGRNRVDGEDSGR